MGSGSSLSSSAQDWKSVDKSAHPLADFMHVGLFASSLSSDDLQVIRVLDDGQYAWQIGKGAEIWDLSKDSALFAKSVETWPIEGRVSPPSSLAALTDIERSNALAPSIAETFAWAHATTIEFKSGTEHDLEQLMVSSDPNVSFFLRGGFVFFDSENNVCKVNILVPSEDSGLQFGSPQKWNPDWTLPLQNRFKKITIQKLHDLGARYYCWVGPNDPVLRVFNGPKLTRGGFVYLFHDEILFDPAEGDCSMDCIIPLNSVLPTICDVVEQFSPVADAWSQYSKAMETPYGVLARHIREEHQSGHLSEAEFKRLTKALHDLTSGQQVNVVNVSIPKNESARRHADTLVTNWLPAWGISTTKPARGAMRSSLLIVSSNSKQQMMEQMPTLCNLELDTFATQDKDVLSMMLLGHQVPKDLFTSFNIEKECLTRWILAIAAQYKPNPYHRWAHAWDTFQMAYILLREGQAAEWFSADLDLLSVLIAAIGHDVGHPGVTNVFLSRTSAEVAITYNDSSVLESMHAATLFKTLLQGDGLNFVEQFERSDYELLRKRIVASVLATDMFHHFQMVERLQHRFGDAKEGEGDTSPESAEHTLDPQVAMSAVLHFADISGCVRPPQIFLDRTALLEAEFFAQGDQERLLGLPVSPMMDRKGDPLIKSQAGFVNFIVAPLLHSMQGVIPGIFKQLEVALQKTKTAVDQETKARDSQEVEGC